ncbi:MAG: polyprenyl synthetase family protein [Desulfovibrionaceae bacterium]|nr:polyprenyl synthetase family protein [Desulfovibrionaceae bacterium]
MNLETMKKRLKADAEEVELFLAHCLDEVDMPERLKESMLYSLLAGGKRLRPALCLAVAEMFGGRREDVLPFAAGLEFIHTYSLVHDDLPAMDDDDLRRGKPTNHKVYGEAMAILTGDALLTEAFGLMASCSTALPAERVVQAIAHAAFSVGAVGMVGGQVLDLAHTEARGAARKGSLDDLMEIHARKTGALICTSCVCGALLAGASQNDSEAVAAWAGALGSAFQIADDILDEVSDTATLGKPAGSDAAQGKTTYPALLGIEKSRELARQRADEAIAALAPFTGEHKDFLVALTNYAVERSF